jgi:hypothetical protein
MDLNAWFVFWMGVGSLDETTISPEEANNLIKPTEEQPDTLRPVEPEKIRLLVESSRIRLAYAHDRQFAVSMSGIRTLPHQIEAFYLKMLPQPAQLGDYYWLYVVRDPLENIDAKPIRIQNPAKILDHVKRNYRPAGLMKF